MQKNLALRIAIILTLLSILLPMGSLTALGHGQIDQSNTFSSGDTDTTTSAVYFYLPVGQQFTPSKGILAGVDIWVQAANPTHGADTLTVNIYEGGTITTPGNPAFKATASQLLTDTSFRGWLHFDFNPPISVNPEQLYVLEVRATKLTFAWVSTGSDRYTRGSAIRQGNLWSSQDFAFQTYYSYDPNDSTPPIVTSQVNGTLGTNGWYTSNVSVNWEYSDPESGIASTSGCGTALLSADTAATTLTCSATNGAGLSSSGTVTIKLDKTAPTITFGTASPAPNAAGWNNSDVSVPFDIADSTSGVASSVPVLGPLMLSSEGSAVTGSVTATDNASNSSTAVTAAFKIDKTAPTTTASTSPVANTDGWNKDNVTVSLNATDNPGGSGMKEIHYRIDGGTEVIASGASTSFAILTEGVHSISYWAVDNADKTETARTLEVKIDKTPPTLTFGPASPAPNAAGWNNSDVFLPFMANDNLSGVGTTVSTAGSIVLSSEGSTISGTVTLVDRAGNPATFQTDVFKIDKTKPNTTPSLSPAANAAGWNKDDVTVTLDVADNSDGSGSKEIHYRVNGGTETVVSGASTALTLLNEGTHTVSYWTVDNADNSESLKTLEVKIDKTPPIIIGSRTPDADANGWNGTNVTVSFAVTDSLSGMGTVSPTTILSTEGANQSVTGIATDLAGNAATAVVSGINIDKSPPTVTFGSPSPPPGATGWNNADVIMPFTPIDSLSGVASTDPISSPLLLTGEGPSITGIVSATDRVGNMGAYTSPPVKIDRKPPTTTALASPAANAAGWNNSEVSVTITGADNDSESGVKEIHYQIESAGDPGTASSSEIVVVGSSAVFPISTEGAIQVKYWAVDNAGNVGAQHTLSLKIDRTPPVLTGTRIPAPNPNGWNNTDVTVSFTCTDDRSGVDTYTGPTTVVTEGTDQKVTGVAVDKAGNPASTTVSGINIDRTLPATTATVSPEPNANGWNNTDVTVILAGIDALAGVSSSEFKLNSADWAIYSGPIAISADGEHTLLYRSVDKAGNIEAPKTLIVRIQRTPPEAHLQFDPGSKDIQVFGRNPLTGARFGPFSPASVTPINWGHDNDEEDEDGEENDEAEMDVACDEGDDDDDEENHENAELRTYRIVDLAGNSLTLMVKIKREGHEIKATIVSLQYKSDPFISPAENKQSFEWDGRRGEPIKELLQKMEVGHARSEKEIKAKYDSGRNQTALEREKPLPKIKVKLPGLVLLRLVTAQGGLNIEY